MFNTKITKIVLIALVPFLMFGCDSLFDKGDTEASYSGPAQVELFPLQVTVRANNVNTATIQIQLIAPQRSESLDVTVNTNEESGVPAQNGVHYNVIESFATAPQFSHLTGTYDSSVQLEIESTTLNNGLPGEIWYSTDGSVPAANAAGSTRYTGPFSVNSNTTVKAITVMAGGNNAHMRNSAVSTVRINVGTPASIAAPVFFRGSGTTDTEVFVPIATPLNNVMATNLTEAAAQDADRIIQIFYEQHDPTSGDDPEDPTTSSSLYNGPVRITAPAPSAATPTKSVEIRAIAAVSQVLRGDNCDEGVDICVGNVIEQSSVVMESYNIDLEHAGIVSASSPGVYQKTISANSSSVPFRIRSIKDSVTGGDEVQLILNLEGGSGVPAAENLKRSTVFIR